jgi:putative transposase
MAVEKLNRRTWRVKLPKLGYVKFRGSRSLDGETIRSATVSRDGGRWFVSFLVDDGMSTPEEHLVPGSAVGVDRGVAVAVATSDGDLIDRQFVTAGERRRTVVLQRKLSHTAKSSVNRTKIKAALAAADR